MKAMVKPMPMTMTIACLLMNTLECYKQRL